MNGQSFLMVLVLRRLNDLNLAAEHPFFRNFPTVDHIRPLIFIHITFSLSLGKSSKYMS